VPITSVSVFMDNSRPPDNPTRTVYTYEPGATQAWTTDLYGNSHFGNLYDGIGLEIALQTSARLGSLQVTSTTQGWSGSAYVSTAEVASRRRCRTSTATPLFHWATVMGGSCCCGSRTWGLPTRRRWLISP
jgi:hypothetical protein